MKNMRLLVKEGYNHCADDYNSARDEFKSSEHLDELNQRLSPGSRILDLGCGAGVPVDKYLVEKGHVLTGVDISEEQIKLAKDNIPQANFLVGDMSEMDFPESSFDAIVSFYAIFHIPREDHLELFRRVSGLLKPGGFFLATLGYEDWEGAEDFHGVTMYWSHYGKDKSQELVKQAGFEIIKAEVDVSGGEHHFVVLAQKP